MRNYALITTAVSALLIGFTLSSFAVPGHAVAQTALAETLPSPSSATAASAPSSASTTGTLSGSTMGSTTGSTTGLPPSSPPSSMTGTAPTASLPSTSSSVIVPVTSSGAALTGAAPLTSGGLTGTPVMPTAVQDAVTRLQKVDQINLDDMIRAQDAINRLDLLLEIEKRQTELKKVRDERNKPAPSAAAAAGLLGSAIPASALNLPNRTAVDTPSSSPPSSSFLSKPPSSSKKSDSDNGGPSEKYSIKRISGSDGRYFAVINTDSSSSQSVHAGDKLPDGSVVKSITLTNVSLIKDKKSKNLTIPSDSYIVRESTSSIQ